MNYSVEQLNNHLWLAVQYVVCKADTWPKFIRKMIWNRNLTDHNRMILVNFAYLNAISEDFLHDILSFTLKEAYTKTRKREIKDMFSYLNHTVILLTVINKLIEE